MSEVSELPAGAVEITRVWLGSEGLECVVRAAVFERPAVWGAVLADIARAVAAGLQEEEGLDPADTLRAIREAVAQELNDPPGESP